VCARALRMVERCYGQFSVSGRSGSIWVAGGGVRPRLAFTGAGGDNGTGKFRNVGKSQCVLIMINPMISTRTRTQALASSIPDPGLRAFVLTNLVVSKGGSAGKRGFSWRESIGLDLASTRRSSFCCASPHMAHFPLLELTRRTVQVAI
jgi:hypothetical protein